LRVKRGEFGRRRARSRPWRPSFATNELVAAQQLRREGGRFIEITLHFHLLFLLVKCILYTHPMSNLYQTVRDCDARDAAIAAVEAGIAYLDTAPYYGFALGERRVGDTLRGHAPVPAAGQPT
jgi:hypothetical protein